MSLLRRSKVPKWNIRFNSNIANQHVFTSKTIGKDISTHQLLQDLGYINQPSTGLIHWLPLGLKVLHKVEGIIRKRMDEVGGEEFSLSSLSGKELWEKTGRWNNTELFKLKIGSGNDDFDKTRENFCLTPTHEEEITNILKNSQINYKNLPILTYQISRKYRYEKRPRGGLLRGREFLMKDAYSFDKSAEEAMEMYENLNNTYLKIFKDLKIPFLSANADSGDIGGSLSKEWHYIHESGEDVLHKCSECERVSNSELTISYPNEDTPPAKEADVRYMLNENKDTLICAYFPKDRKFMPNFIKDEIDDLDLSTLNLSFEEIYKQFKGEEEEDEDILVLKKFIRIMDPRINHQTNLPDFPISKFQKNNFSTLTDLSIVESKTGEICGDCESGFLESMNAIEVGHTFYLGTRYSNPLNAKFTNQDNKQQLFEMGCYGIGISRIVAAIATVTRDSEGLIWPSSISPYDVSLIEAPKSTRENIDEVVSILKNDDISISFDKRSLNKVGFGSKMINSRMLGFPLIIIIGSKFPIVEIEIRGKRWNNAEDYEYKSLFDQYASNWGWEIQNDKVEKHFVHKDHVSKVIKSLLKDL
ncbi:Prolyl-tRNA synthetase [Wickerhamomyces ciferrii]|uniref:proline--tRNA ligase n=1 Tax=Wickerhamomyces ciferrii (strain ATCC 14091 / BCRC 22168 / CBS 111 / JCM 3599 / NBRC 0793 / NRRL Y-1031 F-60-10) TaxID=1206466 RepID=K0K956_WICCF|nr:Prolyl-tRNA synthetase [Wickerhamomyces ciferrii]CCH41425.1 Prolyl-tRNA synthetase [Wickerhamomyces ciferrii]